MRNWQFVLHEVAIEESEQCVGLAARELLNKVT